MQGTLRQQRLRFTNLYNEYNRPFWILILALFIDRLGGTLIFPFFTLYITKKFGASMTEVGVIFGLFSITNMVGSTLGGALADRFGRKGLLIFGLLASAFSSLTMGLVESYETFFYLVLFVGVFASIGGPAAQAMVADLLPPEKRAGGFALLRIVVNLAFIIGPAIGGFLATRSYLLLFVCDAVASTITAFIVLVFLPETKPELQQDQAQETVTQTFTGYLKVLRDTPFLLFMLVSLVMTVVYNQLYTTLAPYLRDVHGVPERGFGFIMALNASLVVSTQFWITRKTEKRQPLMMMALGSLLYAVGFGMYGLISHYVLFLVAMVIITVGEMVVIPVMQVMVAKFAPEDMRGRYMAAFGFTWMIAAAVGPLLGGTIMDNFDPRWLWYDMGLLGLVAAGAFVLLARGVTSASEATSQVPEAI